MRPKAAVSGERNEDYRCRVNGLWPKAAGSGERNSVLVRSGSVRFETGAAPRLFASGGKILTTACQCQPSKVIRKNVPDMSRVLCIYLVIFMSFLDCKIRNTNTCYRYHQCCEVGVEVGFRIGRSRSFG